MEDTEESVTMTTFYCLGDAENFNNEHSSLILNESLLKAMEISTQYPNFQFDILSHIQQSQCSFMWGMDKISNNWQDIKSNDAYELSKHLSAMVDIYRYFLDFVVSIFCDERLEKINCPSIEFPRVHINWNSQETFEHLRDLQDLSKLQHFQSEAVQMEGIEDLRNFYIQYVIENIPGKSDQNEIIAGIRKVLNSDNFEIKDIMLVLINHVFRIFITKSSLSKRPFIQDYINEEEFITKCRNRVNRFLSSYRRLSNSSQPKKLKLVETIGLKPQNPPATSNELLSAQQKLQKSLKEAMKLLRSK